MIIFQNPLAISLAIIGANLSDFDHKMKRMYVIVICLLGALITVILYHFNYPFYLGIGILSLGLVFLFSSHRGFTHSFLGIIFQSLALSSILFFAFQLLVGLNFINFINLNNLINLFNLFNLGYFNFKILDICIIIFLIAILFINKKLLPFVAILLIFTIWKFNTLNISFLNCIYPIVLGLFSHMVLDSFTPSGVKPFIPFSNKKFYKKFGILMILILAFIFVLSVTNIFRNNFVNILPNIYLIFI